MLPTLVLGVLWACQHMIVHQTSCLHLNPCFFNAFDRASAFSDLLGTSLRSLHVFWIDLPSTKPQIKLLKPCSFSMICHAWAEVNAPSILPRWRTIPAFCSNFSVSCSPQLEIILGSKLSNAALKFSRLLL